MSLERLGPYVIQRLLGQGGMGAVYAAVDERDGKPAAVKVLASHLGAHENFRARFESEIVALKRLKHPNIVQPLAHGEQDGHLFYAMEMVDGTSLHEELKRGRRFTWHEVIRFGISLASALRLAHASGVIHRDLKPANVMLARDGQVKLMDFGIARQFDSPDLTAEGAVVGTIDYMAPEQAEAQPVTERSDLYSLGAVFYALLAGRPPFVGKSLPQVIHALRYDAPLPIQRLAPDTPEELAILIDQLLEKDPKDRIPTALNLENRLKSLEHGLSRRSQPNDAQRVEPPADDEVEYRLAGEAESGESPPSGPTRTLSSGPAPTRTGLDGPIPPVGTSETLASPPPPAKPATTARPTIAGSGSPPSAKPPSAHTGARAGAQTGTPTGAPTGGRADERPAASAPQRTRVVGGPTNAAGTGPPGPNTRNQGTLADAGESPASAVVNRFTTIDEDERRRARRQQEATGDDSHANWWKVAAIVVAGLSISGGLWWLARPPSADSLYRRLAVTAVESDPGRLEADEASIDQFLKHYGADPRADEVRNWKEQVEAYRESRKLARRAKLSDSPDEMTTCERLYSEAAQTAAVDPETALRRMRAIVDVFGGIERPDAPTKRAVEVAKRHMKQLEAVVARRQAEDSAALRRRLEFADEIRSTDPGTARSIYAGVVALYADKSWAAAWVEQARAGLAADDEPTAEATAPSAQPANAPQNETEQEAEKAVEPNAEFKSGRQAADRAVG